MSIMIKNSLIHGRRILRNLVRFIHNYNAKLFCADFLFISDLLANGIWGGEYYEVFSRFGFHGRTINSIISILALVRISVLFYQRAIEREAETPNTKS